jgi:hypothetical protein
VETDSFLLSHRYVKAPLREARKIEAAFAKLTYIRPTMRDRVVSELRAS